MNNIWLQKLMAIASHKIYPLLKTSLFHIFIVSLWPLLVALYATFTIYRSLIDVILRIKIGESYGGLLEVSDAVYLVKDTSSFIITSVLIVKSDRRRDMLEIVKTRLKDKIFDDPQRYPKLTSVQYEYGGYGYWIKNLYTLSDCVRSLQLKQNEVFNEEHLKRILGEISGEKFPKNDRGLWELVVSNSPLEDYKLDAYYYYPIITRFNHAIGDGTSLIALLIEIVGDPKALNYSEGLFKKLFVQKQLMTWLRQRIQLFFYVLTIGLGKAFKLSQLRDIDSNALHGPNHNGQKIAAWIIEDKEQLLPMIKEVKNGISGMKFSYVVMTAISSSLTNFFRRNCQPVPANTTSLITILLHFPELEKSKPARLENKTSVAVIDLPAHESSSLSETLREVKLKAEEIQYGDVMTNYYILSKIAGLFPINLASKIIGRGSYTSFITNVPGGSRIEVLDGCVLDNIIPFAPNSNKVGISISILSYDNRLQLGILVDKAILASQNEAQRIADDIFDSLKLLHNELQDDLKNNPLKIEMS